MNGTSPAYGLWLLVAINSALFVFFAFSFARPQSRRDWRSLGAFSAFVVALFTEMYGFPLTIYLLSGWLQDRYPGFDPFSHEAGHLWQTLFGWKGDPHLDPLHLLSNVLIVGGFFLVASAWKVLHAAQRSRRLATTGAYRQVRHPQYVGFVLVLTGFLLQWPTLLTLLMFPVLVTMYVRLARREEREVRAEFGEAYAQYAAVTPAFVPRLHRTQGFSRASVIVLALLVAACSDSPTASRESTFLLSVAPAGGAVGTDPNGSVALTFSRPIMSGMERYVELHAGDVLGPVVAGSWSWGAPTRVSVGSRFVRSILVERTSLVFTPAEILRPGTHYTVHIGGGILDASGKSVDLQVHGLRHLGGQWATTEMMGNGMAGEGQTHMQPGWMHPNGSYGMVFSFTTS